MRAGDQLERIVKGAPPTVATLLGSTWPAFDADVAALASHGFRVLAVASGRADDALGLIGLVGLEDPARTDSAAVVRNLQQLGVGLVLVTGDTQPTAEAPATEVGIGLRACSPDVLRSNKLVGALACDLFASVLPEDKFHLVQVHQRAGHVVGMTGDGVNDAPALRQTEVGIAVSSATDVAKAAASLVLTRPGSATSCRRSRPAAASTSAC